MMNISVILITKNEAHNVRDCLTSVQWADEIIVVDSGSKDNTVQICKEFTDKVFIESDWQGFGIQKNKALAKATHEWVLSIDADERVTRELKQEIQQRIKKGTSDAFFIPRLSSYCGKMIHHSGWYPDYVLRLFRREQGKFTNDAVHERVSFNGKTERLRNHLLHYSFASMDDVLHKMNQYSSLWAENNRHKSSSPAKAILRGWWAFIRTYLIQRGFLDGIHGLALAISNAQGTYYKYMKLYFLKKNKHESAP